MVAVKVFAPKRPWPCELPSCEGLPVSEAISRVHRNILRLLRHIIEAWSGCAKTNAFSKSFFGFEVLSSSCVRNLGDFSAASLPP